MVSMRNKKNFSSNDTFFTSDQSHFLTKDERKRDAHKPATSWACRNAQTTKNNAWRTPKTDREPANKKGWCSKWALECDRRWRKSGLPYKWASASIMCHAFLQSLKSIALKWFQFLMLRFIDSLMYLKEKFRSAFVTNKEKPKTEANLRLIKQGPQEPLREYISWFNKEARSVGNLMQSYLTSQPIGRSHIDASYGRYEGRISFLHIHLKTATWNFGIIFEKDQTSLESIPGQIWILHMMGMWHAT